MTLEITLSGAELTVAVEDAAALLREIGGQEPERWTKGVDNADRRDLAAVAIAVSFIVGFPPAILATLQIREMLARPRLRDRVDAVKKRIEPTLGEAILTTPKGKSIDLRRTSTDAVVDAILDEFSA
jgi:hypothetical protein